MTFLKWVMSVSIDNTVSTSIRSFHSPDRHSVRLVGSPCVMEGGIAQDNHPLFTLPNQPLKRRPRH
jgi:hypothetical protein